MLVLSYLLWGIVQGLTEFLPVSSSAHLVFLSQVLPMEGARLFFFTLLHVGTVFALLFFFRNRLVDLLVGVRKRRRDDLVLFLSILITTVVSGLIALGLEGLSDLISSQPRYTAGILAGMGVALVGSKFVSLGEKGIEDFHPGIAVLLGIVQGLAVFPGISRSGSTIILLFLLGFRPEVSFELSFLAGIPIIFLAFFYEALKHGFTFSPGGLIGLITAFVSGVIALRILRRSVVTGNLYWFGVYCLFLAGLVCAVFPR